MISKVKATEVLQKFESLINDTVRTFPLDIQDDIRQECRLCVLERIRDYPDAWLSRTIMADEFRAIANSMHSDGRACGMTGWQGKPPEVVRMGESQEVANLFYGSGYNEGDLG